MKTINISLPDELKKEADSAVADGHYASFSDLTRTALRQILRDRKLDRLVAEAKRDYKEGKGVVLKTKEDIDAFFEKYIPK